MFQSNLVVSHPQNSSRQSLYRRKINFLIEKIFQRLSGLDLLGKEHFIGYLQHSIRLNNKSKTLYGKYQAIELFLIYCGSLGKSRLEEIVREDLEGFLEQQFDRGLNVTTITTKLKCVMAFLQYLSDNNLISERVLKRRIRLKLPDILPRAINPDDLRQLMSVIQSPRDRAMFLILLRTGMRIGELIDLRVNDLDIRDKKINIYEGEKNSLGRVVYLSEDALFALIIWLSKRNSTNEFLFYALNKDKPLAYSTARLYFVHYLKKSGLDKKGYTLHSLRHTFATELLNAGMRLECVQQLLGHHKIEMTRRYARLTDKSREEEYFRAMALIEQGGMNENH